MEHGGLARPGWWEYDMNVQRTVWVSVSIIHRHLTHRNNSNTKLIRSATSTNVDSTLSMAILRMQSRPRRAIGLSPH